jgi:hypothetical protein
LPEISSELCSVNRLLKVADLHNRAALGMPDVLGPMSPDAHALQWSMLDLGEVIAEERWDLNMDVVEYEVEASPDGFKTSFDDLEAFAQKVQQVIDGLFVGCSHPNLLPRRSDDDKAIMAASEMLVAAIDSSYWLVSAPDEVLARYQSRFGDVTEVDVDTLGLSTWPRRA